MNRIGFLQLSAYVGYYVLQTIRDLTLKRAFSDNKIYFIKEGGMCINIFKGFFYLILVSILTSCATTNATTQWNEELNKMIEEDRVANQQISLSMGEKTFDVDKATLTKAFITIFTNKNLTVKNVDKEPGYLLAEGKGFLPPEKNEEIMKLNFKRLKERLEKYGATCNYTPDNSSEIFTLTLFEKGNKLTSAKVGITNLVIGSSNSRIINGVPPMKLKALYEEMWSELGKTLFIQRESQ